MAMFDFYVQLPEGIHHGWFYLVLRYALFTGVGPQEPSNLWAFGWAFEPGYAGSCLLHLTLEHPGPQRFQYKTHDGSMVLGYMLTLGVY